MRYVGSKNKLSKELAPIIQSYINEDTKGYIEPFVGGANMIDKIECANKFGYDIHEELIELLKYIQDLNNKLPSVISEEEYMKVKNNRNDYEKFYEWCKEMSKNNIVLISEYWMPDEFECIWEKKTTVRIDSNKKSKDKKMERTEKLFIYRG